MSALNKQANKYIDLIDHSFNMQFLHKKVLVHFETCDLLIEGLSAWFFFCDPTQPTSIPKCWHIPLRWSSSRQTTFAISACLHQDRMVSCLSQGCATRWSLGAGLRRNGERMRKWKENEEMKRKWRENEEMERD